MGVAGGAETRLRGRFEDGGPVAWIWGVVHGRSASVLSFDGLVVRFVLLVHVLR